MFDEQKLRAAVAREIRAFSCEQGNQADNRGIESAPYARHASPMARYQPMVKLLGEADLAFMKLPLREGMRYRKERRALYLGYVSNLEAEAGEILSDRARAGTASLEQIHADRRDVQRIIRQFRFHAIRHWFGLPGVSDRVRASLRDIATALKFAVVATMPLNQSTA